MLIIRPATVSTIQTYCDKGQTVPCFGRDSSLLLAMEKEAGMGAEALYLVIGRISLDNRYALNDPLRHTCFNELIRF